MVLRISAWNANGLCQHAQEVNHFLKTNNIDILLISETRMTNSSKLNISSYRLYPTNHPDGTAQGGSSILMRSNLIHHVIDPYRLEYIQATTVEINTCSGKIRVSAIYCPPKFNNNKEIYLKFLAKLGQKFILGGDFNAKHTNWGSRLTNSKGRALFSAIEEKKLSYLSTGEPTYWPTDPNKIPNLINFFITKGIDNKRCKVESSYDLSSDHSPIVLNVHESVQEIQKPPTLSNRNTNWKRFREILDTQINLNSLKK